MGGLSLCRTKTGEHLAFVRRTNTRTKAEQLRAVRVRPVPFGFRQAAPGFRRWNFANHFVVWQATCAVVQAPRANQCALRQMSGRRIQWQRRTARPWAAGVGPSVFAGPRRAGAPRVGATATKTTTRRSVAPVCHARPALSRRLHRRLVGRRAHRLGVHLALPPSPSHRVLPQSLYGGACRRSLAAAAPRTPRRRWHAPSRRRGGHHQRLQRHASPRPLP